MNDDLLDTNNINALLKKRPETQIKENTIYDDYIEDIKNDGRKKLKKRVKTAINVDSRNRSIDSKINYVSTISLENSSIITFKGSRKVIIDHPEHNISFINHVRISIEGITATEEDKFNGIPLSILNYDKNTQTPTYIIYPYENGTYDNRYYYFNLPEDFNLNEIVNGNSGNTLVTINIISNIESGYNDTNYYKINLGKKFKNVIQVRLISTEIPYVAMTITDTSNESDSRFRYKKNNKLRWITNNEGVNINNTVLVSDNITNDNSSNISKTLDEGVDEYMGLYDVNNNLSMWNFYGSITNNSFNINYKKYVTIRNGFGFGPVSNKRTYNISRDKSVSHLTSGINNITNDYSELFNEYIEGYE